MSRLKKITFSKLQKTHQKEDTVLPPAKEQLSHQTCVEDDGEVTYCGGPRAERLVRRSGGWPLASRSFDGVERTSPLETLQRTRVREQLYSRWRRLPQFNKDLAGSHGRASFDRCVMFRQGGLVALRRVTNDRCHLNGVAGGELKAGWRCLGLVCQRKTEVR